MSNQPFVVDLNFFLCGRSLPADHGYPLYSALTRVCPDLHRTGDWSMRTVSGMPDRCGALLLGERSHLRLRVPQERIATAYALAGKRLDVSGHVIRLGIPLASMLKPARNLRTRMAVIKGYQNPDAFLDAAKRQFYRLGASGKLDLARNADGKPVQKIIKIRGYKVIGFGLRASELDDSSALALQEHGLGGRQRMGCGVFTPVLQEGAA